MKHVIVFFLLILAIASLKAQGNVYIKAGAIVGINPTGIGGDIDLGYKLKSNHQFSAGVVCNSYSDKAYFNLKYGYQVMNSVTIHGGVALADWSTDDKRKSYLTYIVGIEFNGWYINRANGRTYCGLDVSDDALFIKIGFKFNYKDKGNY